MSLENKCLDCVHCIDEKYQLLKCGRKTEKLWYSAELAFAFCVDERRFEGECGEQGKFFQKREVND